MSNCNLENRSNNIQLASVNGSDFRQIWHFIRFDGRCLDTNGPKDGNAVHVLPYVGNVLQEWRFYGQSKSGPFYVSPYRHNSDHAYVLDVANADTTLGTNIQLCPNSYKETGTFRPAQAFQINKIDNIGKILSIGDDFYAYMNHPFSGLNAGNVNGNVELVTAEQYGPKQIWHSAWDSTNSAYKITNAYDDHCLEQSVEKHIFTRKP